MTKFLITIFIVTLVITGLGLSGFETLPGFFYQTIILLFIGTVGLHRFLLRTKQNRPDYFVQLYLATLVIKLIAYGAYIFIIVLEQPEAATENVIFFMIVYFVFTALETSFLYRQVNR